MAPLDLILLAGFGALSALGVAAGVICVRRAMRVAGERDGDLRMFFWAVGALAGLTLAAVSAGYILLPIIVHHLF